MKKIFIFSILVLSLYVSTQAQDTLTIYPDKDAQLLYTSCPEYIHYQTTNYGTYSYLRSMEWTTSGYPLKLKALIGIDLSGFPGDAYIVQAKLDLYGTGNHMTNITTGNSGYKSNASSLSRVITSWDENTVTWNSAPTTTSDNQVILPNSTTYDQDYVVDVTNLIKDIQLYPESSDGLMLSLVTLETFTEMCFASSDYTTDPTMHPKLEIIYYRDQFLDIESFENSDTKWENTDGDSIDWNRNSGGTPSYQTGPSGAIDRQYYSYIESSGNGYPSKEAILQSPEYHLIGGDYASINFDYHMYGSTMGSLDLEISINGGSTWSSIWSKSGDQGNLWHVTQVDLSSYFDNNIILRFRGVTDNSYTSDMAVDNIKVTAYRSAELTSNENYIYSVTPLSKHGTSGPLQQQVQYFDGLGRLKQEVIVGSSPAGRDMIKPVVFDNFGRQSRDYLLFAANDNVYGGFRDYEATGDDVLEMQESFFQDHFSLGINNSYAFSRTVYENSPLNRIQKQGAPGYSWQPLEEPDITVEHVQELEYGSNSSIDVRYYYVNTSDELAGGSTYYVENTLFKNTFVDEDENKSEEFKDKLGRIVLKRSWDGSTTKYSTYYVYDDFGLLRFVIPPKADGDGGVPNSTELYHLTYQYTYDDRNRMIGKKLPGVEPVYMVYDNRDRLVATQDGEMRNGTGLSDDDWLITKYDQLNRPVITAMCLKGITRSSLQTTVDAISDFSEEYVGNTASDINGYDNSSWPIDLAASDVLTVTYYDDYNFLSLTEFTGLGFDNTDNIDTYYDNDQTSNGYSDWVRKQVTGAASLVLDGTASSWIYSANYYDQKYRLIQTQSTNYPEGTSMMSTRYDFLGYVLESLEIQDVNSTENKMRYTYHYDHAGRLTDTYVTFNSEDEVLLAQNNYNELGELREKNLHSTDNSNFTQSVDYAYNIRGWLEEINDPESLSGDGDLFGMTLFYDELDVGLGSLPAYNGNISGMLWGRTGSTYAKAYAFTYDELNRIEYSDFKRKLGVTWFNNTYYETTYSYDLNGNINSLTRRNSVGTTIDNLTYTYNGNQIDEVVDAGNVSLGVIDDGISGTDYDYDDNGNMEWDRNKNIKVEYNFLNLPKKVYEESGTGDEILYLYDATGVKWLKTYDDGSSLKKTMFAGSFVYEDTDGDAVDDFGLDYILNPEGKIANISTSFEYHYHLKDHLGNTRVVFDETGAKEQEPDYYPFGMLFSSSLGGENKYLYNGKELQDEQLGGINLDWYCYGVRYYDPALARWHVIDPLAEKYDQWSPYNYVLNNPIMLIDKDGTEPDRNRAGTIEHAASQWNSLDNQSVGGILNYIQNNPESVRYIYTEGRGWIDLQHYFGSLNYGEGPMDMLETASGNKFMQNHYFGEGANESYFSYEDLPSNDFASDSKYSLMSVSNSGPSPTLEFKKGESLLNSIGETFNNANATNPESASNWTKIPFKDHTRGRLPKGISKAEAMKLLNTGNYVPQNNKDKPLDLTDFAAAPTSIEEGDEQVGVTGH